jgi:hypothetical protein
MPILLLRTASVLAAGFLLAGPSSGAPAITSGNDTIGGVAARTAAFCQAPWGTGQLLVPPSSALAELYGQNLSVATLSPADVWMLITATDNRGNDVSAVYHLAGAEWRQSAELADAKGAFGAEWIVARSDTDVWAIGAARGGLAAWHYNGSSWTDHPPARYSQATIDAVALDGNGVLYLAGTNRHTRKGIILSYDGSRWANVSPADPPQEYEALALTAGGTLIAGGGGRNDGTLQERSGRERSGQERTGPTWTTVSLSAPVSAITRVSVAPGGGVYGVGSSTGNQPVLIQQPPGSRSANVLDVPLAEPATSFAGKTGAGALGLDVWLLGQFGSRDGWHHSGMRHFDDGGFGAGRGISQVTIGSSLAGHRPDRPCWPAAAPGTSIGSGSLPGPCGYHARRPLRGERGRAPCRRFFDLSRQREDSTGWSGR